MNHLHYMTRALADATAAFAAGQRPVAALVVRDDRILGSGLNTVSSDHDPTAHAEVAAVREACRALATADLSGATLYTTLEPCPMCLWTLLQARIGRLVMGARNADLGRTDIGDYSVERLLALTRQPLEVVTGVLAPECTALRRRWMDGERPA